MLKKFTRVGIVAAVLTTIALVTSPVVAFGVPAEAAAVAETADPHFDSYGDDVVLPPDGDTNAGPLSPDDSGTPTTKASTLHRVYVAVIGATASTADDLAASNFTDAAIDSLIANVNTYWSSESNSTVETIRSGDIFRGTLTQAQCNRDAVVKSVTSAPNVFNGFFKDYNWAGSNRHLLILTKEGDVNVQGKGDCGRAYGTLGLPGYDGGYMLSPSGAVAPAALPTVVHEYGHNLGFQHANGAICRNVTSFDSKQSSFKESVEFPTATCPTIEYGDFLDVMGQSATDFTPHTSTPQRYNFGYLPSGTVKNVTSASKKITTTINPLSSTGQRAIRIKDPVSGRYYFVEWRTNQGRDAGTPEFTYQTYCQPAVDGYTSCSLDSNPAVGAVRILRDFPESALTGTIALAAGVMPGSTDKKKRHTHLEPGDVFTNYGDGFRVTVNSASPAAGASITVSFVGEPTTTTLSLGQGATQVHGSDARVTATAKVAAVAGAYPAGKFSFYVDGDKVKTIEAAGGTASYALPASIKGGSRLVTAYFYPTTKWLTTSHSAAQTLTVTKTTSTAFIKLPASSVKKNKTSKASLIVKAPGVTTPTGTFTVYSGTKKVKTYTLKASKKGKLQVTLPKFAYKGTKVLTVRYNGSSSIGSSVSAGKSLTIK